MITKEEFNNIEIGDQIKIVDEWNESTCENPYGKMDYLLGQLFVVSYEPTTISVAKSEEGFGRFYIKDKNTDRIWRLNRYCIVGVYHADEIEKMYSDAMSCCKEPIEVATHKSIDDKTFEKVLRV